MKQFLCDFYRILITEEVAKKINLNKKLPLVEILELKKNKSFVAKKAKIFKEEKKPGNIRWQKNYTPEDYLKLIYNSKCLVGNSSSGIREGSFLGVPAVNIGNRQNGRLSPSSVFNVLPKCDLISNKIQKISKF